MDLESLVLAYDGARRQVDVLDQCLADLAHRRPEAVESRDELDQEFDYLSFKMDVLSGVKHMYEEYRDWKWTQLQQESAKSLQEVLNAETTPTESADMDTDHTPMEEEEYGEETLLVHMIPVPLAPLQEDGEGWGELATSVLDRGVESMDVETLSWMGDFYRD